MKNETPTTLIAKYQEKLDLARASRLQAQEMLDNIKAEHTDPAGFLDHTAYVADPDRHYYHNRVETLARTARLLDAFITDLGLLEHSLRQA